MSLLLDAAVGFLPAGIANMTPVFVAKIPGLSGWQSPVDGGRSFRGKRILGDHKTWRGLILGTLIGGLSGVIIYQHCQPTFVSSNHLLFALSISFGALLGDAVKSFFKRQVGVASGKSWFPFDQTDYIIGGIIFMLPFGVPPLNIVVAIVIVYFGLHLLISYLGYLVKLKDSPI